MLSTRIVSGKITMRNKCDKILSFLEEIVFKHFSMGIIMMKKYKHLVTKIQMWLRSIYLKALVLILVQQMKSLTIILIWIWKGKKINNPQAVPNYKTKSKIVPEEVIQPLIYRDLKENLVSAKILSHRYDVWPY